MIRTTTVLLAAALAGVVLTGTARAEPASTERVVVAQSTSATPSERSKARKTMERKRAGARAEPSMWDKTKQMSRTQWSRAKGTWAKEKDKWRACNASARAERLSGTKKWTAIGRCMTS
jgi:hypothetical protein